MNSAMTTKIRNGKFWYVLHGVLEVDSLELAVELLTDRRVTPRHLPEVNQRLPQLLGIHSEPMHVGAL